MNLFEAKNLIVEIGRRVWIKEWVAANDGNISCKITEDEYVCTPTGVSKGFLEVSDLIVVDGEGRKRSGGPLNPSSEIKMHLHVYRNRPDVGAVVHAHPATCTGFAVAGMSLDQCVLPEVAIVLGQIPCVPYGLPSTDEIPKAIDPYLQKTNAVLLANHGALTWGSDLMQAYHRMETLEHFAKILLVAIQLGKVNLFSQDQIKALENLRDRFGLTGAFSGCNVNAGQNLPAKVGPVPGIK